MEHRPSEDELIAKYFRPMAGEGGMALLADAARLAGEAGRDLVLKVDAIVGGVHFFPSDPPQDVAWKALAVNLSDLAAKGAEPRGFLLALALPPDWTEEWLAAFSKGLQAGAEATGCPLLGGDTVKTPGPLTVSVTVIGSVPAGRMPVRMAAQPGDAILASGTIGDAALGLLAARGMLKSAALERRYRQPQPRTTLGPRLLGVARATADISDGLLADAGHIADTSRLAVHIERDLVPLSADAKRAVTDNPALWANVLGGGDDYELAMAVPPRQRLALMKAARAAKVKVTKIGAFATGKGVVLTVSGQPSRIAQSGYVHF